MTTMEFVGPEGGGLSSELQKTDNYGYLPNGKCGFSPELAGKITEKMLCGFAGGTGPCQDVNLILHDKLQCFQTSSVILNFLYLAENKKKVHLYLYEEIAQEMHVALWEQ